LAAAAVAWVVVADRMAGMDDGPGTDLGGARWFLGIWVVMTAAMMLPSTVRVAPTALFAAGYIAVWTVYGLAAYLVFRIVTSFDTGWLAWDRAGPYAAGAVIVAAALYELTPMKQRSLRRCRSPPDDPRPVAPLPAPARRPEPVRRRRRARPRLCRLLRRPDGRAVRARSDEPRLDGCRGRGDLRGEGAAARAEALAPGRRRSRRARGLGRHLFRQRSGT